METPNQKAPENQGENVIETVKVNKKRIITGAVFVIAVAAAAMIWYVVNQNGARKADEAIALADIEQNDSIALQYYQDAAKLGHKSGERAKLQSAIALYDKGQYEQALSYLKDASTGSDIIEAGRYSLMGDCYVNLKNYDEAMSAYKKAISAADGNPQIVPFVLIKEANIYRAQQKYSDEYKAYKEIIDNYPQYWQNLRTDIRKYAERARAAAGE